MRRRDLKDLFVIHTKRIQLDESVVDLLAKLLVSAGFSVWGYDDWDWQEKRKKQLSWQDDLSRDGFLLDPIRAIEGDPPIKPRQVDRGRLDELISHSRSVLFLHPSAGDLSSGMEEELFSLRRDRRVHYRQGPVPVVCWCAFESNEREPFSLGFGYGLGVNDDWKADLRLRLDGCNISSTALIHISVLITTLLLEQRLEHAAKKAETTDPKNSPFITSLSDFDCTPDEELLRAKAVLNLAQTHRLPNKVRSIVHELEELINDIRTNDLNDEI